MGGSERIWRRLWLHTVTDPEAVQHALKHPALADRAAVEIALSRMFFAPFVHQEVAEGEAFARRARWSRAALTRIPHQRIDAAAEQAFARWRATVGNGLQPSLLATLRWLCVDATMDLVLGTRDRALLATTHTAVRDFDRHIKLIDRPHVARRVALREALRPFARALGDPSSSANAAQEVSYLTVARAEAAALQLDERVDQLASVFLGTGTIQINDTLCHALMALAGSPAARAYDDAAVIRETVRCYPVNASITRRAAQLVRVGARWLRPGEGLTVYPAQINRRGWTDAKRFDPGRWERPHGHCFGFGHGVRACPARQLALQLTTTLLGFFRTRLSFAVEADFPHRRSLARPVAVAFAESGQTPNTPAPTTQRWRHTAGYARACATTYPHALWRSLRQPSR